MGRDTEGGLGRQPRARSGEGRIRYYSPAATLGQLFETTMTTGRNDRSARLAVSRGMPSASSSQDYVRLANLLYEASASQAKSLDGNCSFYALAGIPVLLSAFRALLIEGNTGMYGRTRHDTALRKLNRDSEIKVFFSHYDVPNDIQERLDLLNEVRNEIVHPTHISLGTGNETPPYLSYFIERKLLQSTGNAAADYAWISQLKSHRLFTFAFETIEEAAAIILQEHHASEDMKTLHLQSYSRYRGVAPALA